MHSPLYTNVNYASQVSSQITLIGVFGSIDLKSPKISDDDPATVEAMTWFSRQLDPQIGH